MMAKRRLFFDEKNMATDVADVLEATSLLEITEFEFFKLAYRRWYGVAIDDRDIEPVYLAYMFKEKVPAFVRRLAREVIERADQGDIDPKEFGIMPRPLTMDMYNRGLRAILWVTVIMGTLITGAATVAELMPWYQSCYLPPCY